MGVSTKEGNIQGTGEEKMKSFLTTTKGKVIAGILTVAVVAAVIVAVIFMNSGYRTIAVEALNGTTSVTNSGSTSDAYVGQHLQSGDDVSVKSQSDLTLGLDSDKYVYAKENTHFWVEALGKSNSTRTTIKLEEGSSLCRIDNKLKADESFEVETPNSTMSVRGTVFKTESYIDETGDRYTVVDVFEGAVYVQVKMESGANTEESRLLNAGERAIIRSNDSISEFVKADTDEIVYKDLTKEEALFLGKAIDEGRNLSIEKELLYDIVELIEHDFSEKGEEVAATCTEDGYYYDICSICKTNGEKHILKKTGHDYVTDKDDNTVKICKYCGDRIDIESAVDEVTETTEEEKKEPADDNTTVTCENGHKYVTKINEATCIKEGYSDDICSVCGQKTNHVVLAALGHKYEITRQEPTCTADGLEYHICKNCQDKWADTIKATGHNWQNSTEEPTCTSEGKNKKVCSVCGYEESQSIAATGHSLGSIAHDSSSHWYPCTKCGEKVNKEAHSFSALSSGCTVCGWK